MRFLSSSTRDIETKEGENDLLNEANYYKLVNLGKRYLGGSCTVFWSFLKLEVISTLKMTKMSVLYLTCAMLKLNFILGVGCFPFWIEEWVSSTRFILQPMDLTTQAP